MTSDDDDETAERRRQLDADYKIQSIYELIEQRGLDAARNEYEKVFNRSFKDKAIDREIEEKFFDWLYQHPETDERGRITPLQPLRIRPRWVLALILREGFVRGQGRIKAKRTAIRRFAEQHWHDRFIKLKAELKARLIGKNKTNAFAEREADAQAIKAISEQSGLTEEIIRRPNRQRRKKPTGAEVTTPPG